jgi:dipeptidyl aminopeptidase/acylaminoacyl peptidase
MSADGSAARALTTPTVLESYPEWSPTSDTILFTRQTGGHVALETVDLNGRTYELTGANTQSWQGSWSPDGSKIVFVEGGAGGWHIATMRPDGSDHRVLTVDNPNGQLVAHPVWSPDGQQIAFSGGDHSVDLVNADGSNLHAIAFSGQTIERLAWRNSQPAVAVTTQYTLDNVLLARKAEQVTFQLRSIGGSAVADTTVALQATNAAVVSATVGTCRLSLTAPCAVDGLTPDGEMDINVNFRPLHPGPITIGASASSPNEVDTEANNTSTLSTTVSRCSIEGTDGNDTLRASRRGGDYICADGGNDLIYARNGKADVVDGGRGFDTALVDRFDKVIHVERVQRG